MLSLFARVHLIVMSYVLLGGVETVMSRQFGMISQRQGYLLASRATRGPQKPKQEHILQPLRMTQSTKQANQRGCSWLRSFE